MQKIEQIYLRDDIIQFNQQLDKSTHNIKRLRTKSKYRNRQKDSNDQSYDTPLIISIGSKRLQPRETDKKGSNINKNNSSQRSTIDFDNRFRSQRISVTSQMKRRAVSKSNHESAATMRIQPTGMGILTGRQQVKTAKINYGQQNKTPEMSDFIKFLYENKYMEIQRQCNKGGISSKKIEKWLNTVLVQYCLEQKFDLAIQNSAVKKFCLDQISLMSLGISKQNVSRLHRSLFVYSIGYNSMLKEITYNNMNLMKTIWKVYAILLEFCAKGNFQSVIAEIERDKTEKLGIMKSQIQKRQQIIDNSDEMYKQKSLKIQKQLRALKQQNKNLIDEKEVITDDFKRAEQSFNQQVAMRLKFENKINQIHGVHKELAMKHAKLYDDYKINEHLSKIKQQEYKQKDQTLLNLKMDFAYTQKQLQKTKKQCQDKIKQYQEIVQEKQRLNKTIIQLKYDKGCFMDTIDEKERLVTQLKIQIDNLKSQIKMQKESINLTDKDYETLLQDIRSLHARNQQQLERINQLFEQNNILNSKSLQYIVQYQCQRQKVMALTEQKQLFKKIIDQQQQKITLNIAQIQNIAQTNKIFQKNLEICLQNMQKMKDIKNKLQEQVQYTQKKSKMLQELRKDQDANLAYRLTVINELSDKLQKMSLDIKILTSKNILLEQKLTSQIQINKKKIEKLKEENLMYKETTEQAIKERQIYRVQAQKYRDLYKVSSEDVKNEKFQRINLDIIYKQSLQIVQSQNAYIASLNRRISELIEEGEDKHRKLRNCEYIYESKINELGVELKKYKQRVNILIQQKGLYKYFVHPMILEDKISYINQKNQQIQNLINNFTLKNDEQLEQIQNLIKTNKLLEEKLQVTKSQFTIQLRNKQQQIQYTKEKLKHICQKLELEQKKSYLNINTNNRIDLGEKQLKYLSTIQEQSNKISTLIQQLNTIQDNNGGLKKQIIQIQQEYLIKDQQYNIRISQLKKQNKQITQLNIKLKQDKQMIQQKMQMRQKSSGKLFETINKEERPFSRETLSDRKQKSSLLDKGQVLSQEQIQKEKARQKINRNQIQKKIKNATMYYRK